MRDAAVFEWVSDWLHVAWIVAGSAAGTMLGQWLWSLGEKHKGQK